MADNNKLQDISAFFDRLRGTDKIRKSDKLTVLSAPISEEERSTRQKITSLTQYVRNKNWNRRHIEYFEEYRRMVFTFPIIKAAVDIYAEECMNPFDDGNVLKIVTENKGLKEDLEKLFFENLKFNTRGRTIVRETCKFGNAYGYLITRPGDGVVDCIFLPPDTMLREEMYNNDNLDDYRFTWYGGGGNSHYQPWEICHWRNVEDIESEPYGTSILRCVVDTWRRIVLMREALIIYRITRAPQKLLFKIDTDGMTGSEALAFAEDVKKTVKKKPLVNPTTGEIDFKFNVGSIQEDYFLPTYNGSTSDITTIEGAGNLEDVEDYKIVKDDLFAGLKIPKAWLTFEEMLCLRENTLIKSLDGKSYTIKQFAEKHEKGEAQYVYSTNEQGDIVVGEVEWAGPTKTVDTLIKVTLDNNEIVECTPNHPFRMRDGIYKRADELKEGDSLMPLYTQLSKKKFKKQKGNYDYEEVWHNGKEEWQKTHQLVGEWKYPGYLSRKKTVIHHTSFDKYNNLPSALVEMDSKEHMLLHAKLADNLKTPESRAKLKAVQQTEAYKLRLSASTKKAWESKARKDKHREWNKKLNKTKKMTEALSSKLKSGEITKFGIKYKQQVNKEEILRLLEIGNITNTYKLQNAIKKHHPNYRSIYSEQEFAAILNCNVYEFKVNILNDAPKQVNPYNHKVKSVEKISLESPQVVYDLTIKEHHNFALSAGVFVHNSSKATLADEDIRFAKTTLRHQAQFIEGCLHIASVHLFLLGYSEEEIQSFTIEMNNPSVVAETKRLELVTKRLESAKAAWDYNNAGLNLMSYVDVLRIILKLTDDEIQETIRSQFVEKKISWRLEQIKTSGTYEDPEIDLKLAQKKGLTGGSEKGPTGFDGIIFEGKSLSQLLKEKIDQELGEVINPTIGKTDKKKVSLLFENKNAIMDNLKKAKKDFMD